MKRVYFVRHGESEANAANIRANHSTPLTEKGYEQAEYIARRVSRLPVQLVISSTLTRTAETAQVIAKRLNKPVEFSDLFSERRLPAEFEGKVRDDPEALRVSKLMWDEFENPDFRYKEAENFSDVKERAVKALEFIVARPEQEMVIVSHWFFTWMALATATFGKELTAKEFRAFSQTFIPLHNTGLSVFTYDESRQHPWHIEVWNDHAHLAD